MFGQAKEGGVPGRRTDGTAEGGAGERSDPLCDGTGAEHGDDERRTPPHKTPPSPAARSPATISSSSSLGGGSCRPISARRSSFFRGSARRRACAGPLRSGLPMPVMTSTLRLRSLASRALLPAPPGPVVPSGAPLVAAEGIQGGFPALGVLTACPVRRAVSPRPRSCPGRGPEGRARRDA